MAAEQINNFEFQLPFMLQHILKGEVKKGKYFGVHFYNQELHVIEETTKQQNKVGIWEAKIKIKSNKTDAWVEKKKASTFFPTSFSEEILIAKLKEAFENKKALKHYKHIGITTCGIPIAFLFKENIVVSCFPIYK